MSKILRFRAKNFKHIKEVEIVPGDDPMIVVGGLNAQGKTSCLDAIKATLGGKRLIDRMPIRTGEEVGFTEVVLDEDGTIDPVPIIVRRHWEEYGNKTWLTITTPDGYEAPSPQSILDRFFSAVTFDPLAFSRMTPAFQAAALKTLVGLDVDGLEEERKAVYEERREVNKRGVELKALIDAAPPLHEGVDAEPRDINALMAEFSEISKKNAAINRANTEIESAKRRLERAEEELADANNALKELRYKHLNVPEIPIDNAQILAKVASANEHNDKLVQNKRRLSSEHYLEELRDMSRKLTARLAEIEAEKSAALKDVKWPMEGLSVDGEQVMYHGVPLSQVSSSESLDIAVAIGIAMNPELKVLLIKDGALIGDEKLAIIRKRAEETGHQIWVEDVCRNSEDTARCTVIIEDGLVKEDRSGTG